MDAKPLPVRPNLEQFRKEAKDLFKARRSAEAIQRFKWSHPPLKDRPEAEIVEAKLSLADAQSVIAREHAFESWAKFAKHIQELDRIDSPVRKFESAADAIVGGDATALRRLLREDP